MTDSDTPSGEVRARARRNAFYRYLALAFLVALLVGLVSGVLLAGGSNGDIPQWVSLLTIVVVAIGFAWFTRDYFRRVDELDLMDNLWAHLVGFYGGLIVTSVWVFVALLGLAEMPGALAVVLSMSLLTVIAYGLRKLGLR